MATSLIHDVIETLQSRQQKISFAESCTGGQLSSLMTENPGVSAIYNGSVVSYANEAKVEILGVKHESLQKFGAVSEAVAQQMAQGVCHRFHTEWGVSITGIAGPSGGSQEKPVGTVWIAVASAGLAKGTATGQKNSISDSAEFVEARKFFFKGDRKQIQQQSVQAALSLLLQTMKTSAS